MTINMSSFWDKDILEFLTGLNIRPLPLKNVAVFCRKLSFMLSAGLPLKSAMDMLTKQSKGRTRTALGTVLNHVTRGDSLSSSLAAAQTFPKLLCGLTAMGEAAGLLPEAVTQAADYYEHRAENENELAGALAYPVLVSILMLAVMVMAVTFVLPSYALVFESSDVPLPLITQMLLNMSDSFAEHSVAILAGTVVLVPSVYIYLRLTGWAAAHKLLLFSNLYRKFINAQLAQVLSLTLASGQKVTEALSMCIDVTQNSIVKRDLFSASTDVSTGMPLCKALGRIKYVDNLLTDMVRVGEDTGKLPQTMFKCRAYFEQEYAQGVKRLNKLIEPVLTIILGALLGALMLAVILPTFRLADVVW